VDEDSDRDSEWEVEDEDIEVVSQIMAYLKHEAAPLHPRRYVKSKCPNNSHKNFTNILKCAFQNTPSIILSHAPKHFYKGF
jgi:hypothetical protein